MSLCVHKVKVALNDWDPGTILLDNGFNYDVNGYSYDLQGSFGEGEIAVTLQFWAAQHMTSILERVNVAEAGDA